MAGKLKLSQMAKVYHLVEELVDGMAASDGASPCLVSLALASLTLRRVFPDCDLDDGPLAGLVETSAMHHGYHVIADMELLN